MFKAAVIGLGNIGFRLNLDPKRKDTWSHVAAYDRCPYTELAAAVEINPENIELFKGQYEHVPVFGSVREMMETLDIDIISICTPTPSHCGIMEEVTTYPVRAIFCEKPFAASIDDGIKMLNACEHKRIVLAVNHTRRWDDNYLFVRDLILEGKIGSVKAVNAIYPGQIFNIGTHLIDTVRMFLPTLDARAVSGVFFNNDNVDPHVSGWIDFGGQVPFTMIATGKREDLIFEIDVIGDEGRLRSVHNGDRIEWYVFEESPRYSGYRELKMMPIGPVQKRDRLVEAINDIVSVLRGNKQQVNCSGKDGLAAIELCLSIFESARKGGVSCLLEGGRNAY